MVNKKTTDYSLFDTVGGNRDLNKPHIKRLVKSIRENNLLEQNPIIVDGDGKVIDGQHRLEAAKELQVPIYYLVVQDGGLQDVQRLNANMKPWTLVDYLNSYIKLQKQDYIILRDFQAKYKLSLASAIELCSTNWSGNSAETFRQGNFVIKDLAQASAVAEMYRAFCEFSDPSAAKSKEFLRAVRDVYKLNTVSMRQMLKKLKYTPEKIKKQASRMDYLRVFERIYNLRQREKVRFY